MTHQLRSLYTKTCIVPGSAAALQTDQAQNHTLHCRNLDQNSETGSGRLVPCPLGPTSRDCNNKQYQRIIWHFYISYQIADTDPSLKFKVPIDTLIKIRCSALVYYRCTINSVFKSLVAGRNARPRKMEQVAGPCRRGSLFLAPSSGAPT